MTRWLRVYRPLAALLLPLLAGTLACSTLSGPAATPANNPTLLAPTAEPATPVATAQAAPSQGVPVTEGAQTAAPAGGDTETPPPGGVVVDPCSLLSPEEASALLSVPTVQHTPTGQGCLFFENASASTALAVDVFPASQGQRFLEQYAGTLQVNGVSLDPAVLSKLTQDSGAQDMPAAVNDLLALTTGVPGYETKELAGIGTAAFWTWHMVQQNQEGDLFAGKPGALVVLILNGTPTTQETVVQPLMESAVKDILTQLPATFSVAGVH